MGFTGFYRVLNWVFFLGGLDRDFLGFYGLPRVVVSFTGFLPSFELGFLEFFSWFLWLSLCRCGFYWVFYRVSNWAHLIEFFLGLPCVVVGCYWVFTEFMVGVMWMPFLLFIHHFRLLWLPAGVPLRPYYPSLLVHTFLFPNSIVTLAFLLPFNFVLFSSPAFFFFFFFFVFCVGCFFCFFFNSRAAGLSPHPFRLFDDVGRCAFQFWNCFFSFLLRFLLLFFFTTFRPHFRCTERDLLAPKWRGISIDRKRSSHFFAFVFVFFGSTLPKKRKRLSNWG